MSDDSFDYSALDPDLRMTLRNGIWEPADSKDAKALSILFPEGLPDYSPATLEAQEILSCALIEWTCEELPKEN